MNRFIDHAFILATILCTVYSQLVMRWQVGQAGNLPEDHTGKIHYVISLLLNTWVLSGIVATFFAGVSWMLAMTKFDISYAYPFISLNYILVLAAGVLLFQESISSTKLIGTGIVIIGLFVLTKG